MKKSVAAWALAGVVAGYAGLGTSYLVARLMNERLSPVTAMAELIARITPGNMVERAIQTFGTNDKPLLIAGILVFLTLLFAAIGRLARRSTWPPIVAFAVLAVLGIVATMTANGAVVTDLTPIAIGFVTWTISLSLITERLRRLQSIPDAERFEPRYLRGRREFLIITGAVAGTAAVAGVLGRLAGRSRRQVEQARRLLRLPVTTPTVPADAKIGVDGVVSWMTQADDFYLIDTAFTKPAIAPKNWELRIHGMVENELVLTYEDLVNRELVEGWVTLNCVSNEVGGGLIGNAWWSGVLLAPILAEAKPLAGADAVLQTSDDGWNCLTPLDAMTDGRQAMLAVAMNGLPLAIEHGFPVRTIVPGLYGYVSATKWVVDMELTTFEDVDAYWTQRGWGELGPVKMSSRIEVPRYGDEVAAGEVVIAGSAWSQHTGIDAVEVAVDGGAWMPAELAGSPSDDAWVQWRAVATLEEGVHAVRVRATDKFGLVQTGAVADVLPDGATGWHAIEFNARA